MGVLEELFDWSADADVAGVHADVLLPALRDEAGEVVPAGPDDFAGADEAAAAWAEAALLDRAPEQHALLSLARGKGFGPRPLPAVAEGEPYLSETGRWFLRQGGRVVPAVAKGRRGTAVPRQKVSDQHPIGEAFRTAGGRWQVVVLTERGERKVVPAKQPKEGDTAAGGTRVYAGGEWRDAGVARPVAEVAAADAPRAPAATPTPSAAWPSTVAWRMEREDLNRVRKEGGFRGLRADDPAAVVGLLAAAYPEARVVDAGALLEEQLRREADAAGVDWGVVEEAKTSADPSDRRNLGILVGRAAGKLDLADSPAPVILHNLEGAAEWGVEDVASRVGFVAGERGRVPYVFAVVGADSALPVPPLKRWNLAPPLDGEIAPTERERLREQQVAESRRMREENEAVERRRREEDEGRRRREAEAEAEKHRPRREYEAAGADMEKRHRRGRLDMHRRLAEKVREKLNAAGRNDLARHVSDNPATVHGRDMLDAAIPRTRKNHEAEQALVDQMSRDAADELAADAANLVDDQAAERLAHVRAGLESGFANRPLVAAELGRLEKWERDRPKEGDRRGHLVFHNGRWHRAYDEPVEVATSAPPSPAPEPAAVATPAPAKPLSAREQAAAAKAAALAEASAAIEALKAGTPGDHAAALASALALLGTKELAALKAQHGIKASGTKEVVARRIVEAAQGLETPAQRKKREAAEERIRKAAEKEAARKAAAEAKEAAKRAAGESKARAAADAEEAIALLRRPEGLTQDEVTAAGERLAGALAYLTLAELNDLKKRHGLKASGTKADVARKIGEAAVAGAKVREADRAELSRSAAESSMRQEIAEYSKLGISQSMINSGECMMVAERVVAAVRAAGGEALFGTPSVGPAHVWVIAGGKHYDAQNPGGVDDPSRMAFFQDEPELLDGGWKAVDQMFAPADSAAAEPAPSTPLAPDERYFADDPGPGWQFVRVGPDGGRIYRRVAEAAAPLSPPADLNPRWWRWVAQPGNDGDSFADYSAWITSQLREFRDVRPDLFDSAGGLLDIGGRRDGHDAFDEWLAGRFPVDAAGDARAREALRRSMEKLATERAAYAIPEGDGPNALALRPGKHGDDMETDELRARLVGLNQALSSREVWDRLRLNDPEFQSLYEAARRERDDLKGRLAYRERTGDHRTHARRVEENLEAERQVRESGRVTAEGYARIQPADSRRKTLNKVRDYMHADGGVAFPSGAVLNYRHAEMDENGEPATDAVLTMPDGTRKVRRAKSPWGFGPLDAAMELAKAHYDALFTPAESATPTPGPKDGDRNADGLVFRDGHWRREDPVAPPPGPGLAYQLDPDGKGRWYRDGTPLDAPPLLTPREASHYAIDRVARVLQIADPAEAREYERLRDQWKRRGLTPEQLHAELFNVTSHRKLDIPTLTNGIFQEVRELQQPRAAESATPAEPAFELQPGERYFAEDPGPPWVFVRAGPDGGRIYRKQDEVSDAGRPGTGDDRGQPVVGGSDGGGPGGAGAGGRAVDPRRERIVTARSDLTAPGDPSLVPDGLRGHLRPHQVEAVAKAVASMDANGGFLIADGTGVGKSRSLLSVSKIYADRGKKVLYVTKAEAVRPDWAKGTLGGSVASDAAAMGIDLALTRGERPLEPGGVMVTTYDNLSKVKGMVDADTVLIFDEAHALKNWGSARSKHGFEMGKKAGAVLYATATPADKPLHIAYLFRARVFGDRKWAETYEELGLREKTIHTPQGEVTKWEVDPHVGAAEVYRRMAGLFDRMTADGLMIKREISFEGVEVGVDRVQLPPEAHATMDAIAREYGGDDAAGLERAVMLMHQRRQQETYKIPAAVEAVKEELARGHAVVVFASRVNESEVGGDEERGVGPAASSEGTMPLLKQALEAAGVTDVLELHGGVSEGKRRKAAADFQAGKGRVIIATVESGGTGVNLDDVVGDRPRTMVMMTAPFSAVENVQAAGRVWRLNTKTYPRLRYMFADTEVDDWNGALVAGKMKALGAAVSGEVAALDVSARGGMASPDATPKEPYHWPPLVGAPKTKMSGKTVRISGNTFPHRDRIKQIPGWRYDPQSKTWTVPEEHAAQLRGLRGVVVGDEGPAKSATPASSPAPAPAGSRVRLEGNTFAHRDAIKQIPGWKYDSLSKTWSIPEEHAGKVAAMRGVRAVGEKPAPGAAPAVVASGATYSAETRRAVHAALRMLAGNDRDGARERNNVGFNQMDSTYGRQLADLPELTDRQVEAAANMLRKYKRQIGEELYDHIANPREEGPKAAAKGWVGRTWPRR